MNEKFIALLIWLYRGTYAATRNFPLPAMRKCIVENRCSLVLHTFRLLVKRKERESEREKEKKKRKGKIETRIREEEKKYARM